MCYKEKKLHLSLNDQKAAATWAVFLRSHFSFLHYYPTKRAENYTICVRIKCKWNNCPFSNQNTFVD